MGGVLVILLPFLPDNLFISLVVFSLIVPALFPVGMVILLVSGFNPPLILQIIFPLLLPYLLSVFFIILLIPLRYLGLVLAVIPLLAG